MKKRNKYVLKAKKVLGDWPDLEGGKWTQRWHELFPPNVMLGAGRKDSLSSFRELDSRYDYLGVSCCLTEDNVEVRIALLRRVLAKILSSYTSGIM